MALGFLWIIFVTVIVISVLGISILFLSKNFKLKKGMFYFLSIWGVILSFLSAASLPQNYIGEQLVAWSAGGLSVLGLLLHVLAKTSNQRVVSYIMVTAGIFIGILKLFFSI